MLNKLTVVLECSRVFSLPMTVMSWFVVFTYSAMQSGNKLYGLLALAGVCLAHLAANVFDDYFDYQSLIRQVNFDKKEYLKNSQKTKCRYIVAGLVKPYEILILGIIYLLIAASFGLFLSSPHLSSNSSGIPSPSVSNGNVPVLKVPHPPIGNC